MTSGNNIFLRHSEKDGRPFLLWTLPAPMKTLSWALEGGGFAKTQQLCWIQVSPQDLTLDTCPRSFLKAAMLECSAANGLGFMTSARLAHFAHAVAQVGETTATAVVTVGLGNALRAGDPSYQIRRWGTINCACLVDVPLSAEAMLEAMVISAEAKTAAVMDAGVRSVMSGLPATGTGTDCHAIVCPDKSEELVYAGKHTDVGSAIGAAVFDAVSRGIQSWILHHPNHPLIQALPREMPSNSLEVKEA